MSQPPTRHPALLALAAMAAFTLIAWLANTAPGAAIDLHVLTALQSINGTTTPLGPDWLNEAGRDLTALGSISMLVLATALVTGWLLKWGFSQSRPDLLSDATRVFTSSFPSSHAMSSLVTFLALASVLGRQVSKAHTRRYLLIAALLLSLLSGLSRLYLGVHWPSDVLGGWVAGAAWLLLAEWLRQRLASKQRGHSRQ
ncbi:phosphatase PAP2 family protein [Wenzhouxiangella sp. AB-CW3]|uniref:phosphatase PAP2 family protein n=1 Tax=Wenzhouxiangella sp. AB-CW3 TaxID=2771012 RepID=UPI00168B86A9|nr:phosphatase PAP2 family protein [Wenzhouxiangella sp. AB-CW3]QOC21453.1 phosphatase PAP2 family protein [Wenzhouxiangella sp. AB-CW3]